MDIMVEGVGKKFYTPDEVEISLDFYTKEDSYEKALEKGTNDVEIFINSVLKEMNFDKEIMKTRSFRVYEETRFDYNKKIYIKLGFAYTQKATIKFDYSINTVAEFMDRVSKLENPPKYYLSFNVKDMQKCKNEVLSEAYSKAKSKAEAIALAAGKELKECIKTDFSPFNENIVSNSSLDSQNMLIRGRALSNNMYGETNGTAVQDTIQTIFTPEDIEISEVLYCLWITN